MTGSGGRSHGDRGQHHNGERDQAHRQPQLDAEAFGEGAAREVRAEIERERPGDAQQGGDGQHGGGGKIPAVEIIHPRRDGEADHDGATAQEQHRQVDWVSHGLQHRVVLGEHEDEALQQHAHQQDAKDAQELAHHQDRAGDGLGDHCEDGFVVDFATDGVRGDERGQNRPGGKDGGQPNIKEHALIVFQGVGRKGVGHDQQEDGHAIDNQHHRLPDRLSEGVSGDGEKQAKHLGISILRRHVLSGAIPGRFGPYGIGFPHVARTATPPHHATGPLHVSTSSPGRRLWPFGPSIGWRGCSSFWSRGGRRLGSIGLGLDLAGGGGLGGVVAVVPAAQVGAIGSART